ncbi:site-specific integrase [Moraxella bovis]|uniref:tyrosine-type recombinase/integrase n=1 Tax=Moraxella bovis TaxID=476 RepID=UPI002226701D|nr:site-specific integrase [Moraxella bovis]UZA18051.1 site-specific integrase [Moraxella bovis]
MAKRTSTQTLPTGVRIRNNCVQIYFNHRRRAYRITLPHPATAEGISAAAKIRSELITKAKWGILTDDDIAKAKGLAVEDSIITSGVLFQDVAQRFLTHCDANLDTKKGYVRILEHHWMPDLALVPITQIDVDMLRGLIIKRDFKTAKTLNNCLTPLRGVFQSAIEARLITENPINLIKNKKVQIDLPDPFTRDEMNALLTWLDANMQDDDRLYYWYYELAFWSGMRPSEMIALKWDDVDWFNGTLHIHQSRVRGIEKSVTKTHKARTLYLNDRSMRAIEQLKEMRDCTKPSQYVLICPETGEPFFNEKPPRLRLNDAMKACRIRHRPAYNARHTYATMLLMDGVNPVFVADQLGHSLQMLMKRYAKWMHGDKNKQEIAKLNTK